MGGWRVLGVVVIAVLVGVPTGGANDVAERPEVVGPGVPPGNANDAIAVPDVDVTVTHIDVGADGSARWTVAIRTRLRTDQRVADYEAFQSEFRNDTEQYLSPFRERMTRIVSHASSETGREMRATDFAVSTMIQEVPRRWGVVQYEFTWEGFAQRTNGSLLVSDVFQGGFYLAENDSLVVRGPEGYDLATVSPSPDVRDNHSVEWQGPRQFADSHPSVRFEPRPTEPTTAAVTATSAPERSGQSFPMGITLGVAGIGLIVTALFVYRRRSSGGKADEAAGPGYTGAPPTGALETDEEQVSRLLAQHNGRMEQSAVAEELDWSASKTSRVVSSMVEDGTVEKLRIGRKNVLDLKED